ncbi:hypothetical protein V6N13_091079 [Hibiscus sabdariffa]
MSDRQKGLKEVIEDLFPNAEDRKCVRHMYTNFKEKHKGQALKNVVWKAARATYLKEFEDVMDQLKALSEAAYNWIKGKDPSQWSRSHFSTRSKCDMLLNNHCESFNKKKLATNIEQSMRFWPTHAGFQKYQFEAGPSHQYVVNLEQRSCTCRKWDLTGIPCSHAASVFQLNNLRPEHFVNECYHNSIQLAIYSNMITPIKGLYQWAPVTDMEPILPPIIRRPLGRPTKKRRLEPDEVTKPKLSRRGMQANCTKCGKQGHNRRTCRGEVGANQPIRRPTLNRSKPRQPQQPQQPHVPQRERIPIRTKQPVPPPTNVRWMPSQESNISNPPTQ